MGYIFRKLTVPALFFCFLTSYCQEEIINTYDAADSTKQDIPFAVINEVPIYKGCEDFLTNSEKKKCMEEK